MSQCRRPPGAGSSLSLQDHRLAHAGVPGPPSPGALGQRTVWASSPWKRVLRAEENRGCRPLTQGGQECHSAQCFGWATGSVRRNPEFASGPTSRSRGDYQESVDRNVRLRFPISVYLVAKNSNKPGCYVDRKSRKWPKTMPHLYCWFRQQIRDVEHTSVNKSAGNETHSWQTWLG